MLAAGIPRSLQDEVGPSGSSEQLSLDHKASKPQALHRGPVQQHCCPSTQIVTRSDHGFLRVAHELRSDICSSPGDGDFLGHSRTTLRDARPDTDAVFQSCSNNGVDCDNYQTRLHRPDSGILVEPITHRRENSWSEKSPSADSLFDWTPADMAALEIKALTLSQHRSEIPPVKLIKTDESRSFEQSTGQGRSRRASGTGYQNKSGSPVFKRRDSYPDRGASPISPRSDIHVPSTADWIRFIVLCFMWYSSSAVTNNVGKQLLSLFKYPVTLTYMQFVFVAVLSFTSSKLFPGFGKIRSPTYDIIMTTAPLSAFQILGHVFSTLAISRVSVSFAHTIKALSPLFTVAIYRLYFRIIYSHKVYTSLIPLTIGVMLVCSNKVSFHLTGFLCSMSSTIIFVLQTVVSKKLFIQARSTAYPGPVSKKLDKLNLLFYSATLASIMMFPMWFYADGFGLITGTHAESDKRDSTVTLAVTFLFVVNAVTHFFQAVFAFWILSLVSPVTYSIASLVKRIFVILASILYFGDSVSTVQAAGIALTFAGLYMYDRAKMDVAHGEAQLVQITERNSERGNLPMTNLNGALVGDPR